MRVDWDGSVGTAAVDHGEFHWWRGRSGFADVTELFSAFTFRGWVGYA